jgi:hypothetical protein
MQTIPSLQTLLRKVLPTCAFFALLFCSRPHRRPWAAMPHPSAPARLTCWPVRASTRAATHTMHELQAPTGTKVREYLGNDGKVFAVSWQGPFRPNLRQLLGAYYDTYMKAARAARPRPGQHSSFPGWSST